MRRWSWTIIVLVAACRNSFEVDRIDVPLGVYPLANVNHVPLPAAFGQPDGCEVIFGSGELALLTKSDYTLEIRFGYQCADGRAGHDALAYSGTYVRGPRSLRGRVLDPPPPPEEEIAIIPEGDLLKVTISGEASGGMWSSPAFFMGPRQPLPASPAP
jgi:hypothetical protein